MKLSEFTRKLYHFLYFQSWRFGIWQPPDRKLLTRKLFIEFRRDPNIKRILFVGVQDYTSQYTSYWSGKTFVTIDPDPGVRRFGSQTHICDRLQRLSLYETPASFDLVILNGVIGFGINDPVEIDQSLTVLARHLRTDGLLLVGLNPYLPSASYFDGSQTLQDGFTPRESAALMGASFEVKLPLLFGLSHQYRLYTRTARTLTDDKTHSDSHASAAELGHDT